MAYFTTREKWIYSTLVVHTFNTFVFNFNTKRYNLPLPEIEGMCIYVLKMDYIVLLYMCLSACLLRQSKWVWLEEILILSQWKSWIPIHHQSQFKQRQEGFSVSPKNNCIVRCYQFCFS